MMPALFLNLAVAVVWLFLQAERTAVTFFIGYAIGFVLLALFRPVLHSEDYVRRTRALVAFAGVFLREFLLGSLQVLRLSVGSLRELNPAVLHYDVRGLSVGERLFLAQCISLTPGTTTVEVAEDGSHLVLHALSGTSAEAVRAGIDRTLRRGILAFTR